MRVTTLRRGNEWVDDQGVGRARRTTSRRCVIAVSLACLFTATGEAAAASASARSGPGISAPSTDGRLIDEIPSDAGSVVVATVGEPDSVTLSVTGVGTASGLVTDPYGSPVASAAVTITASSSTNPTLTAAATTAGDGRFSTNLPLLSGSYSVVATAGSATSPTATVVNHPSLAVAASIPVAISESTIRVSVQVTDLGRPANAPVTITAREPVGAPTSYTAMTGADGKVGIDLRVWRNPSVTIVATRNGGTAATTMTARTSPRRNPAPTSGPQPQTAHPLTNRPVGTTGNPRIARISNAQWATMRGVSWQPGCVARSRLRMVDVNYVGFDGYRHRGRLIVNKAIAVKTARIFNRLHARGYPIRQIRPVDVYGKNAGRPGANDYKSMAAGNTSGFNCRYVVGKEYAKAKSPHSSGRSLDINPWENPYVARNGVFPNRYYLNRRNSHPAVFKTGRAALEIVRQGGCSWGGSFSDFHHFDC